MHFKTTLAFGKTKVLTIAHVAFACYLHYLSESWREAGDTFILSRSPDAFVESEDPRSHHGTSHKLYIKFRQFFLEAITVGWNCSCTTRHQAEPLGCSINGFFSNNAEARVFRRRLRSLITFCFATFDVWAQFDIERVSDCLMAVYFLHDNREAPARRVSVRCTCCLLHSMNQPQTNGRQDSALSDRPRCTTTSGVVRNERMLNSS